MVGGEPVVALDLLRKEYDEHRALMATLSVSRTVMAELFPTSTHVYVPLPDMNAGFVPTAFTTEEFTAFHRGHTIPVVAEDDPNGPVDIGQNAHIGALKLQEVTVDAMPRLLWVVQPGYYSENVGLELPE